MQRPYIFTGYRVGFTFSMCFRSVFQIHNETGNIWTHLLGFGLFVHLFVRTQALLAATDGAMDGASSTAVDRACFWCFLGAAQVCMLCSAYYHCVGCVSEGVHRCTLNLDLSGVVVLIAGSFVPGLRFGFYCHPLAQAVYMALIVAMAAGFLMVLLVPQGKRLRTPVLIGMVVFGLLPAVHWCFITPRAHVDRFAGRLLAMFLLYGLGVILWSSKYVVQKEKEREREIAFTSRVVEEQAVDAAASPGTMERPALCARSALSDGLLPMLKKGAEQSVQRRAPLVLRGEPRVPHAHSNTHYRHTINSPPRYPERLLPGRFDHWFHSHQLWHTCIVLAAYVWYDDLLEYYQVVRDGGCAAGAAGAAGAGVAIGSANRGGVGGGLGGFVQRGGLRGNPMTLDTVRRVAERGGG
jgi:channel protein (hemolysin III family)